MTNELNRWRGHPVLAGTLRLAIIAIPLAVGYGVSVLGLHLLSDQVARTRWWLLLIAAVSIAVCFAVERVTRRLLPLAALLKLSMLFPDRAPSRFRIARKAVSTRMLNQRVAQARTRDAAAVAEAVLELITALTAHDRRTRGHSERVRVFAELLGEELHLPRDARDKLRWAALLHDIGKLHVAPAILNKPAKLNDTEWKLVAQHPAHGEELLGPLIDWLGEWGSAVRQHHESYDGSGYPDQLAGVDISRAARIVAIVDSYEVMTAHRAYKKPMATVAAREELARCAGTQFDPAYVRAFLSISVPRLLWAMGPGALAMNLPLLRVLAESTNKGLLAIPQSTVVAGAAAAVIGATSTIAPVAAPASPIAVSAPVSGDHTGAPTARTTAPNGQLMILPPLATSISTGQNGSGGNSARGTAGQLDSSNVDDQAGVPGPLSPTSPISPTSPSEPTAPIAPSGPVTVTAPVAPVPPAAPSSPTSPATTPSSPSMAAPVFLSTPPSSGVLPTITFTWTQVAGLNYEYQLDGGGWTSLGATNSYSTLVLIGTHTFRLRARAGSGGPTPTSSYTFTVII